MKIYLYGMICGSNSFRLNAFPNPDEYSEIEQYARFIGGETGTCATVLSSLGTDVRIDGTHIGRSTAQLTRDFYRGKTVVKGQRPEIDGFIFVEIPHELRRASSDMCAVHPDIRAERGKHRRTGPCLAADKSCILLNFAVVVRGRERIEPEAVRAAYHAVKINFHSVHPFCPDNYTFRVLPVLLPFRSRRQIRQLSVFVLSRLAAG